MERQPVELIPDVVAARTSLRLPEGLPMDVWCGIGEKILAVADSSAWWIGDWLVFGEEKYPDRYKRAMAKTSLDYQTLRNYAWIARRFGPARRRVELTFQHHVEVAALAPGDRDHWLDLATRLRWSRNELRRQIRNSAAATEPDPDRQRDTQLRIPLSQAQILRCEAAARQNRLALSDWVAMVLDNAVHGSVQAHG